MILKETCLAILDTINHPIVFVDNDHVIRYLNHAAMDRYYKVQGHANLIGESIFGCHSEKSRKKIADQYERLKAGENEITRLVSKINKKISMVAVRDRDETLLGYYERFEKTE